MQLCTSTPHMSSWRAQGQLLVLIVVIIVFIIIIIIMITSVYKYNIRSVLYENVKYSANFPVLLACTMVHAAFWEVTSCNAAHADRLTEAEGE
jgi:uncharacterized integral membrane protein